MIDWMIQVFRVLKKSSPKTFFLAQYLMDEYFRLKHEQCERVDRTELHIIGLVCVFISSKFEDVYPIRMSQILNDAAHGKFSKSQVLEKELEILKTMEYKIHTQNVYENSCILLKNFLSNLKTCALDTEIQELLFKYLLFLSQLSMHSLELTEQESCGLLAPALALVALKYLKLRFKNEYKAHKQASDSPTPSSPTSLRNILFKFTIVKEVYKKFNEQVEENNKQDRGWQVKKTSKMIINHLLTYKDHYKGLKNLEKSFPHFLTDESMELFK